MGTREEYHEEYSALAVGTVRCESGCRHRFEGSSRLCALCGRPSRVTECALPRSPFALPSRVFSTAPVTARPVRASGAESSSRSLRALPISRIDSYTGGTIHEHSNKVTVKKTSKK